MIFKDREDAAHRLLAALAKYKGQNPVILGIPRGAIPMARILAEGLNGKLGAILVHKISAPANNEFAISSIGISGKIHKMPSVKLLNISESYIQDEAKKELRTLKQRYKKYGLPTPDYKNKIVIIVDDGIATGATILAAIHEVRHHKPQKLIVAAAVAAKDSATEIRGLVDELILLEEPESFYSVSQFFENFPQVTDEMAITLMHSGTAQNKPDASVTAPSSTQ